jgi:SH3-like domain-containing protein
LLVGFCVAVSRAVLAFFVLGTAPALAQTPEVPATAPHSPARQATAKKPVGKTASPRSRQAAAHGTPVVAPHHGPVPRQPGPHRSGARVPGHHPGHPIAEAPTSAHMNLPPPPHPVVKLPPKPVAPVKPVIPADQGTVTGLHLPRYASLKTGDVNMRSGPGSRYPVLWTYKRFELPVRIEREFDVWRLVEDMDGIKGWVHQATLTGRRTFVVTGTDPRTMRAEASDSAPAVAVLKPGVVGRVRSCDANAAWCQVQVGDYRGWLARADFWGTDAGEAVAP